MIQLKTPNQIEGIRLACRVVHRVHEKVQVALRPGLSTYQIDNIVKHSLREMNAKSAFLKYCQGGKVPFPAHSCVSVNEEVVHGIGRHDKILKEGDVVTVDIGAIVNGYVGDSAVTHIIGKGTPPIEALVEETRKVLYGAIAKSGPDIFLYDISSFIFDFAKERNYGVVTDYYGHGVGLKLHEPPQIPNCRPNPNLHLVNVKLQPGMTITYEPMFTLGSGDTEELSDGWTVVTKDRSIAVHWEHTILITDSGVEILT